MKTAKQAESGQENMIVHLLLPDEIVHGRKEEEVQETLQQGLLLLDYLSGKISIGKFAELMGMSYEAGRDWLHRQGIPTMRKFSDPELEKISDENYRTLSEELGIPLSNKQ
jgi:predicted HTH domain antitoxin